MLFSFLKYLQPTSYFSLFTNTNNSVFLDVSLVNPKILEQLTKEKKYKSTVAQEYDLSWQLLNKGYISEEKTIQKIAKLPIHDEYVFIRKYFSKFWVFYVLIIRIFSLKNPFLEVYNWFATRHVKRSDYLNYPIQYKNWNNFNSKIIQENPLVSIIIPTLNRYQYLKDVLHDLESQDYKNFEVIVVDQSQPFREEFYKEFNINLKASYQKEKALWLARNNAIKNSKGEFILLFDDDSRVDSNWITNHLKCVDFFEADLSSGVSISVSGAAIPKHYSYFKISDQLDTGNVLLKKKIFKNIGLFDRQFEKQRMGDGEYGLRSFLNGYKNISNPYAKRVHLKVNSGGLREMGSWDAFRTKKWFAPKPIPSVLYFFRKYFGNKAARLALLRTVPLSIMPYQFKKNKPMLVLGVLVSILILPIVLFQVLKSWRLASQKLKEGALIDLLN